MTSVLAAFLPLLSLKASVQERRCGAVRTNDSVMEIFTLDWPSRGGEACWQPRSPAFTHTFTRWPHTSHYSFTFIGVYSKFLHSRLTISCLPPSMPIARIPSPSFWRYDFRGQFVFSECCLLMINFNFFSDFCVQSPWWFHSVSLFHN